jgi:hypothetical protein
VSRHRDLQQPAKIVSRDIHARIIAPARKPAEGKNRAEIPPRLSRTGSIEIGDLHRNDPSLASGPGMLPQVSSGICQCSHAPACKS